MHAATGVHSFSSINHAICNLKDRLRRVSEYYKHTVHKSAGKRWIDRELELPREGLKGNGTKED